MAKLFVVGIPRDMDETELLEIFMLHGMVNLVTIVTDKDTNKSLGYAFVHMFDDAGAQRAIAALNGAEIDDRTITVRIADNKNENAAPTKQFIPQEKKKRPRKQR